MLLYEKSSIEQILSSGVDLHLTLPIKCHVYQVYLMLLTIKKISAWLCDINVYQIIMKLKDETHT